MSSDTGERDPVGQPLSNDTEEFLRSHQEAETLMEALGDEFGPRQHARYANAHRNKYFESGRQEHIWIALQSYEAALSQLEMDDALRSWVLCNRLNLYLHEHRHGRFDREELLDEIDAAEQTARSVPLRDRKRGKADLWWLAGKRASLTNEGIVEAGERGRHPELLGGTAIQAAGGPV